MTTKSRYEELKQQINFHNHRYHVLDAPLLEIASREIRSRIAKGHSVRYYLPTTVYEYINEHHLYD